MSAYDHLYEKIASWTAICTRLTLFTDADTLTVVDTCRDRNFDLFLA